MQSSMDHMPQMAGMQRNFLREFQSADAPMYGMQEAEPFQPTTPFPEQTPPGMAYVRQYGPLQPLQTSGDSPWAWNQGPWPWEKEAN